MFACLRPALIERSLRHLGFAGELYPINPKYDRVWGRPCFKRVLDLGCGVGAVGCLATARTGPKGRTTFIDSNLRAIALTDMGRAVADAAVKVARQITRQTLTPLTAVEQRAVIRLLRKLT